MFPTRDQVERTAYDRWLRRGQVHGHDREDWYAAEKELLFLLNYETIANYPLDLITSRDHGAEPTEKDGR